MDRIFKYWLHTKTIAISRLVYICLDTLIFRYNPLHSLSKAYYRLSTQCFHYVPVMSGYDG